ncbi:MAG: hypothetical protein HN617_13765 [Planctomycetaceae bacterium]|jgi:hypothetical protein|nr:hypothetical protein [Planctomycetaceae bacterium]MBT4013901.1 hypothetical protein [Planctomycetaceae bacterium]MBT4724007.1 hypothetical protein [Planctomycetaceae bacterium]MBT4846603.1 hypothetical protein [Planctomycetaceae bacterium]MBT5126541.1 hypothetical protein [Planctomycetaceae bacterium]
MRLTLRTMLAYLDDILDPEDAKLLGKKITESDFASDLVYRTLSSKRRVNLSAPRLDGTGIGSDPNTVAEYLDNTLEESRIPEFEKICLESEMHLGEVASCHTILTKVVEEPIEINDALRTRLIQLVHVKESESLDVAVSTASMPQDVVSANATADYMPANTHPLWRALVVLTFFALVIIIGLRAIGPLDESHMIIGPLLKMEPKTGEGLPGDIEAPAVPSTDNPSTQMLSPIPVFDTEPAASTNTEPIARVDLDGPIPIQHQGDEEYGPANVLGEFLSDRELLVAVDLQTGTFERVVSAAVIGPNTALQTFAPYRPEIILRSGARLMLVNASELLIPAAVDGLMKLHLRQGCLVLRGEADRNTIVPLRVGDREIDVYLTGLESLVTVQVTSSGSSAATSAQWLIQIHCTPSARWQDRGVAAAQPGVGTEQAIQVTTIQANGTMKVTIEKQLPSWYLTSQTLSASQQQTAQELVAVLSDSSELLTDLRKAFETHRLLQVKITAARCLMHLGEFNPIMATFNNVDYRSTWEDSVAAISKCMKQDEANMEQISEALQSRVGDQTEMITAILGTCTDEQLQGNLGEAMVQGLGSTVMLERVISFIRLKKLTGKTQMYFPDKNPNQQVVSIRRWQQLWADKKLQRQGSVINVSYLIP